MKSFKNIKLVVSDFDGVFTDGKLTVYSDGRTSKVIDYNDIMAISIILKKGINFAIISGEQSCAIELLKEKFPQIDIFQQERKKINVLKNLAKKYDIQPENMIYIGDDINDIECLNYVSNPISVPNAHKSVKELSNINITKSYGGNGVIREISEAII